MSNDETVFGTMAQLIQRMHDEERCPRLMVNALTSGVDVPEWVKERWGEVMPIDLDPTYPLELTIDEDGLHCSLSFGHPYWCTFPWGAIYAIQDRDSALGLVIEEHLPLSLSLIRDDVGNAVLTPSPNVERLQTGPLQAGDPPSRRLGTATQAKRAETPQNLPRLVPLVEREGTIDGGDGAPGDAVTTSSEAGSATEEAPEIVDSPETRRARFRVISGGKRG